MRLPDVIYKIAASVPRGRLGWAPRDTWSGDLYICRVVGEMLLHLAENGHGWPESEEFPTYEDWASALRRNGDLLVQYASDPVEMESRQPEAQASPHWVADHLGAIWD